MWDERPANQNSCLDEPSPRLIPILRPIAVPHEAHHHRQANIHIQSKHVHTPSLEIIRTMAATKALTAISLLHHKDRATGGEGDGKYRTLLHHHQKPEIVWLSNAPLVRCSLRIAYDSRERL